MIMVFWPTVLTVRLLLRVVCMFVYRGYTPKQNTATLSGIPQYLLRRLQSVMNSAARLVFSSSRYDHITPLLRQLHWLKAAEQIDFKLPVLVCFVYKCLHGAAPSYPSYLADELCLSVDLSPRRRLRSAPSSSLVVRRIRVCQPSATELFLSPPHTCGTVCRST